MSSTFLRPWPSTVCHLMTLWSTPLVSGQSVDRAQNMRRLLRRLPCLHPTLLASNRSSGICLFDGRAHRRMSHRSSCRSFFGGCARRWSSRRSSCICLSGGCAHRWRSPRSFCRRSYYAHRWRSPRSSGICFFGGLAHRLEDGALAACRRDRPLPYTLPVSGSTRLAAPNSIKGVARDEEAGRDALCEAARDKMHSKF